MGLPSVHMKDVLVSKGYTFGPGGAQGAWSVWIGKQPDQPDRAITLYDSSGLAPNPRWLLDYPGVQIRIRGGQQDYEAAALEIRKVRDYLLGIESYDASDGDRIVHVNGIGDIMHTGWDDSNRPEFVCNFRLIIEPAPNAQTNREPL